MTVVELIACMGLLLTIVGVLGQAALLAVRWKDTADAAVRATTCADRVRRVLLEAAGDGRPVESWTSGGRTLKSTPGVLLIKRPSGALVLEHTRARLFLLRFGAAPAREELLAQGVERATFDVVRGAAGEARGIAFEVKVAGRAVAEHGFVALRAEAAP